MSPRWGSTPRLTDWLTVSRNMTLTLTIKLNWNIHESVVGYSSKHWSIQGGSEICGQILGMKCARRNKKTSPYELGPEALSFRVILFTFSYLSLKTPEPWSSNPSVMATPLPAVTAQCQFSSEVEELVRYVARNYYFLVPRYCEYRAVGGYPCSV
jgi:hypothetical protein